jgi:FdhD protein
MDEVAKVFPPLRTVEALRLEGGSTAARMEAVAEEVPVVLVYNGLSHAVMMATPADLVDFAYGFSLTEGILAGADEIYDVETRAGGGGIEVHLTISAERFAGLRHRKRALAGRTGCGLCGVDSIGEALRPVAKVASTATFSPEAITRAMADFQAQQPLNAQVGAVHAAGLADETGAIHLVREDVGRHNALDKLLGAAIRERRVTETTFVVVTSRCSYEMIHKTAAAGIPLIASVSAPTALAIDWATSADVTLAAFAREGRFTLYAGTNRVART